MKKCKVIEYLEGSLSDGGAETLVKDYVLGLDGEIFEPIVLVDWIFPESANYKRLKNSNVRIITLYPRYSIFWRAINKFFRKKWLDYSLKRVLRKEKPDVLHIHLAALSHVFAARKELGNTRLFYTCHSITKRYLGDNKAEVDAAFYLVHHCGLQLIALHRDMANEINQIFNIKNTIVIPNGIDLEKFSSPLVSKEEMLEELGIPTDAFVLGHVGRFVSIKNQEFILEVFTELSKRREKCWLLLIGSGEDELRIKKIIKEKGIEDKVVITSGRTDIPELLNAMNVFIFPSLFEGFGNALLEAQAAGLKCVVSDTINKEAFLSDSVIPLSLGDSIEKWCDVILDDDIRSDYPNRLSEYDMKLVVNQLEKLYLGK